MAQTPGPWDRRGQTIRAGATNIARVAFNYCPDVSEDPDWHGGGPLEAEAVANARLIAAAPELLEVLEAIVEDVRDDESFSSIDDQALLYRAEAAIAKATGQEEPAAVECPECERDLGPDAMTCPTCSGGDNWTADPMQTTDF